MDVMKTDLITSIQVRGYQEIRIETDDKGTVFVYMGDNYVAFSAQEYRDFAAEVINHK